MSEPLTPDQVRKLLELNMQMGRQFGALVKARGLLDELPPDDLPLYEVAILYVLQQCRKFHRQPPIGLLERIPGA